MSRTKPRKAATSAFRGFFLCRTFPLHTPRLQAEVWVVVWVKRRSP